MHGLNCFQVTAYFYSLPFCGVFPGVFTSFLVVFWASRLFSCLVFLISLLTLLFLLSFCSTSSSSSSSISIHSHFASPVVLYPLAFLASLFSVVLRLPGKYDVLRLPAKYDGCFGTFILYICIFVSFIQVKTMFLAFL